MKSLVNLFVLPLAITLFSQAGWSASISCVVQDLTDFENPKTLAAQTVDLDGGKTALLYSEGPTYYTVNKDEKGGMQLSIYKPAEHEVIALGYSSNDQFLAVMGSKPLRSVTCGKATAPR